MDALANQGLSLMKELCGQGAAPRLWGEDLPPDSLQAWAALARGRRIWEEHSNAYLQGETAYRAISFTVEYTHDDLGHLTQTAVG
eukprot:2511183-Alexandrium_andersonii.AAC.1